MNVLLLGGTGSMGTPLAQILSLENNVYVTSRTKRTPIANIRYVQGNAQDKLFLKEVLESNKWDAVVDFMVRSEEHLRELLPLLLSNTSQYVFISSCRVYAQSELPITEDTPRLLDVSEDIEFLNANEYSLSKAREEDVLLNSGLKNFTIVRPTITYNTYRMQLGVLEKENWLYRAINGRSIVFSEDICNKLTTMTLGDDVSTAISSIIGKSDALGEIYHITSPISLKWSEVLEVYRKVLNKHLGKDVPVVMTNQSINLNFPWRVYQVKYSRYFNRSFDNQKINNFCDTNEFTSPYDGLAKCLEDFLRAPRFDSIPWDLEALNDRAANEWTPLREIPSIGNKIVYLCYRLSVPFLLKPLTTLKKIFSK